MQKKNTKNPYYWLYFFYFTLVFFALLWVKQALLDIWDKNCTTNTTTYYSV